MNIESLKDEQYRILEKEVKTESDIKALELIRNKIGNNGLVIYYGIQRNRY